MVNEVSKVVQAFQPNPLRGKDELKNLGVNTNAARTGDPNNSPISRIYEACRKPVTAENKKILLCGTIGCGLSTELGFLEGMLLYDGYPVKVISCKEILSSLFYPNYTSILLAIGAELIQMANQYQAEPDMELIKRIGWILNGDQPMSEASMSELLRLSDDAKRAVMFASDIERTYQKRINTHCDEWTQAMNELAAVIAAKLDGKQPILILDDLDRTWLDEAGIKFWSRVAELSAFSFHIVCTCPIAIFYSAHFLDFDLSDHFFTEFLHTINVVGQQRSSYKDGQWVLRKVDKRDICENGYLAIKEIVGKRADLSLFEIRALNLAIEKTGGHLFELFRVIQQSAMRATRRGSKVICSEDMEIALHGLQSRLTKLFEQKDYPFLVAIATGRPELKERREFIREMIQAGVIIEYAVGGSPWLTVHPLVVDYLIELGLMD